jgi:DNA repair protein RecO (recombination protein O)
MATANKQLDSGWILHSRAYGNTSLILELFSRDRGRCGVVVRGGRRNTQLQPFRLLHVRLGGRGELARLDHVEPAEEALPLSGKALYCGLYVNELLVRLLHRDDPHPELVPVYRYTLEAMLDSQWPLDVILRRFEMALLDTLGYGFDLERDQQGEPLVPAQTYRFEAGAGLVKTDRGWPGSALLGMAAGRWDNQSRPVARELMRQALAEHLQGREMVSRRLFSGGAAPGADRPTE